MINFTIAGKAWTDDDLMVVIPSRYREMFEGHNFKTMHDFDLARMFASCADEAWYYNKPWRAEDDERSLRRVLSK